MGVPRHVFQRWWSQPSLLSEDERVLIHQHPILGRELVSFVRPFEEVGTTIRTHHERFDGTGYPDCLQGDQIPWLARLLSVAIAYAEAIERGHDPAERLKAGNGKEFDPEAVRLLHRCLRHVPTTPREREMLLRELAPGMVLAKGIYNSRGMLLLPEGQVLTDAWIDKLHAHNRITPIAQSLFVCA